jgi:hypothetical protein
MCYHLSACRYLPFVQLVVVWLSSGGLIISHHLPFVAPIVGRLLCCCLLPPPAFVITRHCATANSLVSGRSRHQLLTAALRWSRCQQQLNLCCSCHWLVVALLSAAAAHFFLLMPSCNRQCSCCQPLLPPIVDHCPQTVLSPATACHLLLPSLVGCYIVVPRPPFVIVSLSSIADTLRRHCSSQPRQQPATVVT